MRLSWTWPSGRARQKCINFAGRRLVRSFDWVTRQNLLRPIMRKLMSDPMPAIIAFMLMNSGRNVRRTFSQYVPPIMFF